MNIYLDQSTFLSNFKPLPEWMRPLVYRLLVMPHFLNDASRRSCLYFTQRNLNSWSGISASPTGVLREIERTTGIKAEVTLEGKSTVVTSVQLPKEWRDVQVAIATGISMVESRVNFLGKKFKYEKKMNLKPESDFSERVTALIDYLNTPRRLHAKGSKTALSLKALVIQDFEDGLINHDSWLQQLCVLENMVQCAQPFYRGVKGSARIFPDGVSLVGVSRKIRKAYVKEMGWTTFDLESAQFAIVAKVWNVPVLSEFLSSGESLWSYLEKEMGFADKDLFKTSVYALAFGASMDKNTKDGVLPLWLFKGLEKEYAHFLTLPIIKAVYEAREARKGQIRKDCYVVDAFGNKILLNESYGRTVNSLLAMEIQSYEVLIMLPLAEYLMNQKRVEIALWLHDGISVHHSLSETDFGYVKNQMSKIIDDHCKVLGIQTRLVQE